MSLPEKTNNPTLVAEKDALAVYFEALLRDEPATPVEVAEPPPAPVADTAAPVAPVQAEPEPQPEWGANRFQAMLFKVAGLTLAVPLSGLSGIREWVQDEVTPMPGHAPWYLGLVSYRGHNVPVVDTAQLVLPADRLTRLTSPPAERIRRIVFIDDGHWGLGCDEVADVITLGQDEVRWRTERTKRRWLAGTVIDHMCALLDPAAFAQMLATGIDGASE